MISSDGLHAEVTASRLRAIPLFAELDEATLTVMPVNWSLNDMTRIRSFSQRVRPATSSTLLCAAKCPSQRSSQIARWCSWMSGKMATILAKSPCWKASRAQRPSALYC